MIINIRGTNGSGKSTLAMKYIAKDAEEVVLAQYSSPTKKEPDRLKDIIGYVSNFDDLGTVCVVGPYDRIIGGLDRIPSFEKQREAIRNATKLADTVICEGVLASTVYSSWSDFFKEMKDVEILYLDTPLETCYERIKERQIKTSGEEKAIKTDQVAQKVRMIESTRKRFSDEGVTTTVVSCENAPKLIRLMVEDRRNKGIHRS